MSRDPLSEVRDLPDSVTANGEDFHGMQVRSRTAIGCADQSSWFAVDNCQCRNNRYIQQFFFMKPVGQGSRLA